MEKDLFFDEGVDVARYDVVKYPALHRLMLQKTRLILVS
jgi:hypothetical protein